jgi:hypothetical protein
MLNCNVDSVRAFLRIWLICTALVLGYAYLDVRLNPWLTAETHFSMEPDLSRLPELLHWGGRLLSHRALGLLVGNAVILGGVAALLVHGVVRVIQRARRKRNDATRISIVPGGAPTSIPPSR